jgi:hypothetical protein
MNGGDGVISTGNESRQHRAASRIGQHLARVIDEIMPIRGLGVRARGLVTRWTIAFEKQ